MLKTIAELMKDVQSNLHFINTQAALAKLESGDAVLIDVREPSEAAAQTAATAINIPRGLLEMKALSLFPNEEQVLIVHCATGIRAGLAAEQLNRLGYQNVFVISSSIDDICSTL